MLCRPKLYLPFCPTNFLSSSRSDSLAVHIQVNTNFISNPHLNRASFFFFLFGTKHFLHVLCMMWYIMLLHNPNLSKYPNYNRIKFYVHVPFSIYLGIDINVPSISSAGEKNVVWTRNSPVSECLFITMTAGSGMGMILVCPYFHKMLCWQKLGQDCLFLHWIYRRRRRHTGRRKYFVK